MYLNQLFFILLFKASMYVRDQVVTLLINHQSFDSINEKDEDGQASLHYGEYLNIFKYTIFFKVYYF